MLHWEKDFSGGRKLNVGDEYDWFQYITANQEENEVYAYCWIKFPGENEWTLTMDKRTWSKDNWNPGSVPNGADKEDILKGPSFCHRDRSWTRNNDDDTNGTMPVKDFEIGVVEPIGSLPIPKTS